MSKIYVEKFDDNVLRDKRYPNGSKDDIHIVSTPIKPRTRKVRLGFQWVDEDGNVIREIPPTPPCKQYLVIHPDRRFCHGVDVEEMLKGALEYERVR